MSVVALHQTSKPHELAREINRLTDGIERDSKLAGEHLATLKAGKPPGITWEHYLKDCGVKVSARHADRLIEAYQGPTRKSPIKPKPPSVNSSTDNPDFLIFSMAFDNLSLRFFAFFKCIPREGFLFQP